MELCCVRMPPNTVADVATDADADATEDTCCLM